MKRSAGVLILAAGLGACPSPSPQSVCVRILEREAPHEVVIENTGDAPLGFKRAGIRAQNGRLHVAFDGGPGARRERFKTGGSGLLTDIISGSTKRTYRGELIFHAGTGGASLVIINRVPLEDYVIGVVGAESGDRYREPSALRALSVVCRSFALAESRHRDYDLCDMAHCQIYRGTPPGEGKLRDILAPAAGRRIRLPGGRTPLFHACCGGRLAHPLAVWGKEPNRRASPEFDAYAGIALCAESTEYSWARSVARERIERILTEDFGFPRGQATGWRTSARDPSGRSLTFAFRVVSPAGVSMPEVSALGFASAYGVKYDWKLFRSLLIEEIRKDGGNFILQGRGFGHGVGMCMAGAHALAKMGLPEIEILRFYYPECEFLP